MRILLLQPPWSDIFGSFDLLSRAQGMEPPLGIAYLGAIAERMGHVVRIIDAEAEQLTIERQIEEALSFDPDLVGITATSPIFHKAKEFSRRIKLKKDIPVIVGGAHASVLMDKAFDSVFDFLVYREGEHTFGEFLDTMNEGKRNLRKIEGLIFRDNGSVIVNPPRPLEENLDIFPFPARHLLKADLYVKSIAHKNPVRISNIASTRGCPFECVFCSEKVISTRKVRFRSPQKTVEEMVEAYNKLNINHFVFIDSTLTLNRSHILEIARLLKRHNLPITWEGGTRANVVDRELLKELKEAGLSKIYFGIESGDPRILKIIKKGVSLKQIRNAYRMCDDLGIETICSLMLGHPGETIGSIFRTIFFVKSIKQVKISTFSIATPYPGTELLEMAKNRRHGLKLLTDDYSQYLRYYNKGSAMSVNYLSPRMLGIMQKLGLIIIHFSPHRFFYILRRTPFKETLKNIWAFIRPLLFFR